MKFQNPNIRTLVFCWLALMILTIGTMLSGRVTSEVALSATLIISLAAITWFKSMLILRYYLNLRTASKGWNKAFNSYLFIVLGIITLIFLLGKTPL
ncbi:MAG: cytochrome C oxidase subunit IV family protein [Emcibacter sp.]|nr:cytochrome C oxidase subunit IV family protein [Emcibacter sp.]